MKARIVMATFNPRLDLLERQIASLQAQTVEKWECTVLDDGSADRRAVERALARDPRFTLLPPAPHLGPYRAFETLLASVPHDLPLFLCDQDDAWNPGKIERMLAVPGTVFSAMRVVDDRGTVLQPRFLHRAPSAHSLTPAGLLLMNSSSGAAMKLDPEVLGNALPFPAPDLRGWHDQWLAAVAARLDRLHYLDEPLTDYTRHASQVTGDGVRRLSGAKVSAYRQRVRDQGLATDLRGRSLWVMSAARQLLELAPTPDPELTELANGRFLRPVARSVAAREMPLSRAALLLAGGVGHAELPA